MAKESLPVSHVVYRAHPGYRQHHGGKEALRTAAWKFSSPWWVLFRLTFKHFSIVKRIYLELSWDGGGGVRWICDYSGAAASVAPGAATSSSTATATAAAAAAGESSHWHAGGDSVLWSTGTLSQGTCSSLSPFSFSLLVCLPRSPPPRPPSPRHTHTAVTNICSPRVLWGS